MFILEQLLPGAVVATLASSVICAIAIVWARGRAQQVLLPFIVAIGYASGHVFITGWVSMPPADSTNWLPMLALVAAACGSILPFLPHRPARKIVGGLVAIGALRMLLEPQFRNAWPSRVGWIW